MERHTIAVMCQHACVRCVRVVRALVACCALSCSFVSSFYRILPIRLSLSSVRKAWAMDSRTVKRAAQVAHIRSKPYYVPIDVEPDPFVENCPTRMWKYRMRAWVETLKKNDTRNAGGPDREEQDVTPGS